MSSYRIRGEIKIPHDVAMLAKSRASAFFTHDALQTKTLETIGAEIYIQGINDAAQVMNKRRNGEFALFPNA